MALIASSPRTSAPDRFDSPHRTARESAQGAAYAAAIAAGATGNGEPAARLYYDPRYYAGSVLDPDGYSLEFVYKSWQHPQR